MFEQLEKISTRPAPFEFYTARELWTDDYISEQMLKLHLDDGIDAASRNSAFIDRSADWIAWRFDIAGRKVADFGCGPGLYAARLARMHADVTGIDFSGRSIRYAREAAAAEGLQVRYVNADYLEFETDEPYDLIMMIMCDFCALSPVQRRKMLAKFQRFLKPSGAVLLDVYSLSAFDGQAEKSVFGPGLLNGFWSPRRYYGFLNTFKYEKEKLVLDKYTIMEADRTRTFYNWLQHFSPEELEREFRQCGFALESLYADVAGTPFSPANMEFAAVAKKI